MTLAYKFFIRQTSYRRNSTSFYGDGIEVHKNNVIINLCTSMLTRDLDHKDATKIMASFIDNQAIADDISEASVVQALLEDDEELDNNRNVAAEEINRTFSVGGDRSGLSRAVCTVFPPIGDEDRSWLHPTKYFASIDNIKIWCCQFEECPQTEQTHVQLYVEFKKQIRFGTLRRALASAGSRSVNVRSPKRCTNHQRACGVNYCLKPDSRLDGTESYIWEGNAFEVGFDEALYLKRNDPPKRKTQRSQEKDEQIKWIESKPIWWTWEKIVHENMDSKHLLASCSWGAKYHYGRPEAMPRRVIKEVIVMYGAGGTGKTTLAKEWGAMDDEHASQRYYARNPDDGKFWGGGRTAYHGQRVIHFEEFCGQETAADFKRVCDLEKEGPQVNIKGSGATLNHDTVVITSNHHPAAWYRRLCTKDSKQWAPICRRLTKVWFFPEYREDGSRNTPDADHEPFYIDQTEEFEQLIESYNDAKEHAQEHWALSSDDTEFVQPPSASAYDEFEAYARTGRANARP